MTALDMKSIALTANEDTADASQSLDFINKMEITNNAELKFTAGVAAEVKEQYALVDEKKKEFTAPLRQITDSVNKLFNPALKSLAECEVVLKSKMGDFKKDQASKRDKALESHDLDTAEECVVEDIPGVSFRTSAKVNIRNTQAAVMWCITNDRLDLLTLNTKALERVVKLDPEMYIDGVDIDDSSTVAITVAKVQR